MSNTTHLIERALLCKKVISKEQLIRAKKVQKTEAIGLEESLIKLGYSTYPEIIECLAEQYDLQIIDVNNAEISEEMINLLPMELIKKHNIVPVSKSNGVVTIAMSSPPDLGFMDNLRFMLGADVSGVLDSPENIRNVIRKYFDQESTEAVDTLLRELRTGDKQLSQAEIEKIETSYKSSN